MKLDAFKNLVTSKVGGHILKARIHSPKALFVAGVVGVVGAAVLASRATLKVTEVLDEHTETLEKIEAASEMDIDAYTEADVKRDKVLLFAQTGFKLVKLYAPSVALGGLAIAALTGSHVILTKRNTALTAAYAALNKGWQEYRKRVVGELGEEKDREFLYGTVEKQYIRETDEGPVVENVKIVDPSGLSVYAKFFDEHCPDYDRRFPESNLMFLRANQEHFNRILQTRGWVLLNEAYKALGIPETQAGAVVGWALSEDGDNYVDFGIYRGDEMARLFVNGHEGAIRLDFNVNGVVVGKIGEKT